jgi:hypothetical protein
MALIEVTSAEETTTFLRELGRDEVNLRGTPANIR